MDKFGQLFLEFRKLSTSKRGMGDIFERFIKQYFLTERLYSEIVEQVWLWGEFPYNGGKSDTGIDLVVKTKDTNEYWAIQCKFYLEKYRVTKADVDTFLSASGKAFDVNGKKIYFAERYLVSTTDKWGSNAEDAIKDQAIPVNRIRLQDLNNSSIDWEKFSLANVEKMKNLTKKTPRPHQTEAINDVMVGFEANERGKLIMACGTGKTYTSLKIAERVTNGKGNVLFLVPSIALLNQSLLEWAAQTNYEFRAIAICSDPKASKSSEVVDTVIPASTDVVKILYQYESYKRLDCLTMFFSTYQSIDAVADVQKQAGFVFDIIICDEAHRTTGVTLSNKDESNFVKVHSNDFIQSKKRLYMTATPRIYADESKNKATQNNAILCSMDDETIYGPEFHLLGFAKAVSAGLLADYKVIVLAVDEGYVSRSLQRLLTDDSNELKIDDSVKIIGCWNGLSKKTIFKSDENNFEFDPAPMKRAVAFCNIIEDSKKLVDMFNLIIGDFKLNKFDETLVDVELEHVDGTFNALAKKEKIDWLKEDSPDNVCRVLTNARCLSEGIDVPALDAVMFLNPKNSIIDIIQSVGRVMRKSEGKKYGYIILPIGIPAGVNPETALSNNKKYKIVWDVLQALRAHDDRFNNTINRIELNKGKPKNIQIIGVTGDSGNSKDGNDQKYSQMSLNFEDIENWKNSIYGKIVKKCGSRLYWEAWAKDIADIAQRHINRINILIENDTNAELFDSFLQGLRKNLNSTISKKDAIEMLAQHMITKPVFDALFENYQFIKNNPVSKIMEDMLDLLDSNAIDKEQETLDKFYLSVQERAKGIDNSEGKQKIVIELYEQFFKIALPKQVEKLGIVYTPIEVVDFIIKSIEHILNDKFKMSIADEGVHILDPFTGTGTFIVRLLKSGIISTDKILYKYTNEIHANEIVLLAYYIAAINIEETFHDLYKGDEYVPFEGIVLADTFALSETHTKNSEAKLINEVFYKNSDRAQKQLLSDIQVIIGNPPYSVGQKAANDNNKNVKYENLDISLSSTYLKESNANFNKSVYDTYIKAFRWASDRIADNGVIGFVTNGSYIDSHSLDGFRKCLLEEFNYIYCFNLRGDQRTSGERSRKEGGKIFGSGSRATIAITFLVKKKGVKKDNYIHYYDIGDYLARQKKLEIIKELKDVSNIHWSEIVPDKSNDWINFRNPQFDNFIALGDKKQKETISLFRDQYSLGLSTNRDAWIYNYDKAYLKQNMKMFIEFFDYETNRCHKGLDILLKKNARSYSDSERKRILVSERCTDLSKINWSTKLDNYFYKNTQLTFEDSIIRKTMVRPFCKMNTYYSNGVIERCSRWNNIFPDNSFENLVICVSGPPLKKEFSSVMSNMILDLNLLEHSQCFSLYWYEKEAEDELGCQLDLFDINTSDPKYKKRDTITDKALHEFQKMYSRKVTKEDIFYYIYGVLNCKKYKGIYVDNLSKTLPRIPYLDRFMDYVTAGRKLSALHINYENCEELEGLNIESDKEEYSVNKMTFAKEKGILDKSKIIYNNYVTISNIPTIAYEYIVNGKSAIEWIMEKYCITVDKDSKIVNDPNKSADYKYIFNLLLSVISMSVKTVEIVDGLPEYKEI